MNKFLNYYNSLCTGANTPSVFTYDPFVIAMKELLFIELEQVVFYIEKLKNLNVNMKEYTDKVIDFISILIINLDFKKESFFVIIQDLNQNKKMLEKMYISACEKTGESPELLNDNSQDYSDKETILKALNEREKNINVKKETLTKNKKILYEIMINLVLKACNNLIDLKNYNTDLEKAKDQVLKLLNNSNLPAISETQWIEKIKDFSKCNYHIMKTLYSIIEEKYGPIIEKEVEFGTKEGKAILVSGTNYLDLEKILKAVKGLNINVYTHHDMLTAFQYEQLSSYENLTGHYQKSTNNFPLDFASFPGPIYISQSSTPKIDVIRGQLYTSAKYPAYGIAQINNDDFSEMIKYALESDGFKEDTKSHTLKVGYTKEEININIELIKNKIIKKEINKISIIGATDRLSSSNEYINRFYKECPDDNFIISFASAHKKENFWHVNAYYDFAVVYKIVEELSSNIENISEILSIFLTDCNNSTISHIFNLIYLNVKKIYLGPCCPGIINPTLTDGLYDLFKIKPITDPRKDIEA